MRISLSSTAWIGGTVAVVIFAGLGLLSSGVTDSVQPTRGATGSARYDTSRTQRSGFGVQRAPVAAHPATPLAARRGPSPVAKAAPAAQVVFQAAWGRGAGELGREVPTEGAPEGPASFVVGPAGRVYVLDQVNVRVQVFEQGRPVETISLPRDTYQDIGLDRDGRLVLLDRLVNRSMDIVDLSGRLVRSFPLEGRSVPEGGGTTGLFVYPNGIWVEVEHTSLVRIADENGKPDVTRSVAAGRYSADGHWLLRAALAGRHGAVVLSQPVHSVRPSLGVFARIAFPRRAAHLTALGTDLQGRVVLAALLMQRRSRPPFEVLTAEHHVVVLKRDGTEHRRLSLPVNSSPEEQFRGLRVAPDGALYHLSFDPSGVTLRRIAP